MRALFTVGPAYGKFFPTVGLASALSAAGHEVLYATAASFCPVVERAGFTALPAGRDWLQADAEENFPQLAGLPIHEQNMVWVSQVWGDLVPAAMAPDLVRICGDQSPDVIVNEQWEMAGPLVAEAVGLPHAAHGNSLFVPPELWQGLAWDGLSRVRSALGLPGDSDWSWINRHAYLDAAPAGLQYEYELPELVRYRPVSRGALPGQAMPEWIDGLDGRPLVYVTMGTIFNRAPQVFGPILGALAEEPVEAIVQIGEGRDASALGPVPDNVHLEEFLAQPLVLARSSLVICHGGFNTVAESLMEGLPMVLIPQGADQHVNAVRCQDLGVGLHVPKDEVTEAAVRDAVHRLLTVPSFRESAGRIRETTGDLPPVDVAVRRLEALVS